MKSCRTARGQVLHKSPKETKAYERFKAQSYDFKYDLRREISNFEHEKKLNLVVMAKEEEKV